MQVRELLVCPYCQEYTLAYVYEGSPPTRIPAKICVRCGRDLGKFHTYCPRCGLKDWKEKNGWEWKRCPNCGEGVI